MSDDLMKKLYRDTINYPWDVVEVFCEVDPDGMVPKSVLYRLYTWSLYHCEENPNDLERWKRMSHFGGSQKRMTETLRKYFKDRNIKVSEARVRIDRYLIRSGVNIWDLDKYKRVVGFWKGISLKVWGTEDVTMEDLLLDYYRRKPRVPEEFEDAFRE